MSKAEMDEGFFSREEHEMANHSHRDVFGNFIERPLPPRAYEEAVGQAATSVGKAYERQFEVTSDEQRPQSAHQRALDAYWAASTPAEEAAAVAMLQASSTWDPTVTPPGAADPVEQALADLEEYDPQTMGVAPQTQTFYVPPGGIGSMGPNMQEYDGATPHMPEQPARALPPNPKQIFGDTKVPLHLVPSAGVIHEAQAFKEGARKYGPYNWRANAVEAMTYIGAALRHIYAYLDGEDYDQEVVALTHHLGEARACLGILLDALETGNLVDNRPLHGAAVHLLTMLKQEQGR